jgi:UPF0755 protein
MKRLVRALLAVMLAAALACGTAWAWFLHWLDAPGPARQDITLIVPRGAHVGQIARQLAEAGIVTNDRLLEIAAWQTGLGPHLKAGEYVFAPGETPRGALEQIAAGRVVVHHLTIPEGLSIIEIRRLVAADAALAGEWPSAPVPEGSLLPETYNFIHGDTRGDLLGRMRRAQQDLLDRLWAGRAADLPLASPEQAVVLASIVEAETPLAAERPRVAGVYLNRLKRGMRLQADPTVIYGITQGDPAKERPLTRADLAQETPWNTYVIAGLPPTPINNPGRASLAAVLQPEQNGFLYFVATGKGGHVFAETYDQHLRNVAAYRASQKQR